MNEFIDEIHRLDSIKNFEERLQAIFLNIYVGNFFDVGSNAFLEFLLKRDSDSLYMSVKNLLSGRFWS